ncbi:uncharacterized protein LOC108806566 isoform X1 [Raphanus sativus]|uniref:Uncharacterized protein LOC108806566 isoform X1 n=2 Tax=Raphanus sativus TaxID=3726 RepID=A0A9W3C3A6_RAPSA|nr:uncharacterized protein LOC108806566 isoform X1 [Raphanus sativus]XP_056846091.1 uncharacterized protein LOC108806566 isoform X1 [Raphanus sativus]XP_056846092.1 uncharacterized protein LOC108806566 isoform X1 [Raphanus sativus]
MSKGFLASVDSYMNLQLGNTEEHIDGQLTGNLREILISRLPTFRHRVNAGSMFIFSGFDVVGCNQNFRLSDSLLVIRFSASTNFDALTEPASPILVERFRFRDLDSLLDLANTSTQLPEMVVTLSLFESQAVSFHNKLESGLLDIRR